ncbi:polysaccharide deacetylase family protein [Streptomyces sp. WAC01280]|uniref:polysaccharide deacetylase family protein n=2 Tax=Streptomyces TaxID=1883 RepID=UPI001C8E2D2C|nr:polysaccharide deacetylase family protein [Streptomyces sp. WAC01280]
MHDDGRVLRPAGFAANEVPLLAAYLKKMCGDRVIAVVDSTNGLLDGPLRNAGIRVFRADPWDLPQRPVAGSVPAHALALRGRERAGGLVETDTENGTLKGRFDELDRGVESSAGREAELTRRGYCLTRGDAAAPRVALTFDDGPSEPYTGQVLDVLRDYGVAGTFFCVGLHASTAPGTLARIREEGHAVGNHTWSHPFLPDLTHDEMLFQLDATNKSIAEVTGEAPTLIRPPYGSRTPETLRWTADHDMTTVLWDRDSWDWAVPGPETIVENALDGISNGSIVLMHDGGGDRSQTIAALPVIIESLLTDGFQLVTVDRLRGSLLQS